METIATESIAQLIEVTETDYTPLLSDILTSMQNGLYLNGLLYSFALAALVATLGLLVVVAYVSYRMEKDGFEMVKEREVKYGNSTDC